METKELEIPYELQELFRKLLSYDNGLFNQVALDQIHQMTDDEIAMFDEYLNRITKRS
jgi:hypothetical protein